MEPGTKYLISELARQGKNGRRIDKVILLSTPETYDLEFCKKKSFDGIEGITPEKYYIKKIVEFLENGGVLRKIQNNQFTDIDKILDEKLSTDFIRNFKVTDGNLRALKGEIYDQYMKEYYQVLSETDKKEIFQHTGLGDYIDELMGLLDIRADTNKYIELFNKYHNKQINIPKINKLQRIYYTYARIRMNLEENLELSSKLAKKVLELQREIDILKSGIEKQLKNYIEEYIIQVLNDHGKIELTTLSQNENLYKYKDGKLEYLSLNGEENAEILTGNKNEVKKIIFQTIHIKEGSEYKAISEAVASITNMKKSVDKVNLFIDLQGGVRTTIFTLNAVLNMLRHYGIVTEKSLAIAYESQNFINEIKDETETNRIFDLVSGMDEFFSYGKGKKFYQYYQKYRENMTTDSKLLETTIVQLIKDVSDSIELCDVIGMENGIKELMKATKDIELNDISGSDSVNPIFVSLIPRLREEYNKLLKSEDNLDRLQVVQWCVDKELYQQALTLIEAKMPEELVRDGILYYCKEEDRRKKSEQYNEIVSAFSSMYAGKENYKLYNPDHYFIKDWLCSNEKKGDVFVNILLGRETYDDKKSIKELIVYSDIDINNTEKEEQLRNILNKYYELAELRNQRNHASENMQAEVRKKDIEKELKDFVRQYENIRSNVSAKSASISYNDIVKQWEKDVIYRDYLKKIDQNKAELPEKADELLGDLPLNKIQKIVFQKFYMELLNMKKFGDDYKLKLKNMTIDRKELKNFLDRNAYIKELVEENIFNIELKNGEDCRVAYLKTSNNNACYVRFINGCSQQWKKIIKKMKKWEKLEINTHEYSFINEEE